MRTTLILISIVSSIAIAGCRTFHRPTVADKELELTCPANDVQVLHIELGRNVALELFGDPVGEISAHVAFRGTGDSMAEAQRQADQGTAALTAGPECRLTASCGAESKEGSSTWRNSSSGTVRVHAPASTRIEIRSEGPWRPYLQSMSIRGMEGGVRIHMAEGGHVRIQATKGPLEISSQVARDPSEYSQSEFQWFLSHGACLEVVGHEGSIRFEGSSRSFPMQSRRDAPPYWWHIVDSARLQSVTGDVEFLGVLPRQVVTGSVKGAITFTAIPEFEPVPGHSSMILMN
ncbi:MAG: hypothetical protein L0Z55_08370 [Planctomycetes bacterium]|nr:hypothetical protein [Planctomycetota bacterium]